jgi:F-type H+-transporting ATPase subunit c
VAASVRDAPPAGRRGHLAQPAGLNKIFTPMILGLALIESLVIYGLVIAFLLYGKIG